MMAGMVRQVGAGLICAVGVTGALASSRPVRIRSTVTSCSASSQLSTW
jgi:hypothetical protein